MKKTIKKIVVFSALLTLLGSPAVFAAKEGTQSQTKEQQQEGTQTTQTKEQKQEGSQSQTKTNTSSQACDNN